jgi:hypothetical protein
MLAVLRLLALITTIPPAHPLPSQLLVEVAEGRTLLVVVVVGVVE